MNTTDIEALITDLRQPGGNERELSDRVALALGWRLEPTRVLRGYWMAPNNTMHQDPPLYVDDISALLRTLPEGWSYGCGNEGPTPWAFVRESPQTTVYHVIAPTAARALCIARLMLRQRTGR